MSAELAVNLAMASVVAMVAITALIAAVVLGGVAAAWPRRTAAPVSPGAQYWVRSTQTDTAPIVVVDMDGRRIA